MSSAHEWRATKQKESVVKGIEFLTQRKWVVVTVSVTVMYLALARYMIGSWQMWAAVAFVLALAAEKLARSRTRQIDRLPQDILVLRNKRLDLTSASDIMWESAVAIAIVAVFVMIMQMRMDEAGRSHYAVLYDLMPWVVSGLSVVLLVFNTLFHRRIYSPLVVARARAVVADGTLYTDGDVLPYCVAFCPSNGYSRVVAVPCSIHSRDLGDGCMMLFGGEGDVPSVAIRCDSTLVDRDFFGAERGDEKQFDMQHFDAACLAALIHARDEWLEGKTLAEILKPRHENPRAMVTIVNGVRVTCDDIFPNISIRSVA